MKKLRRILILCVIANPFFNLYGDPIVVWDQLLTHPNAMVPDLLKRALIVTEEEYGAFQIVPSESMEQGRVIKQMNNGHSVQVAVFAPNPQREKEAIAIRIPVTGSLLSYRICLVKKGQQARFNTITDLTSLKNSDLSIGQHKDWPDTTIMEANGLTLWKSSKYGLLFDQLSAGRFDCFSRGANEVVQEFYSHGHKGLEIENSLIIYYPLPLYYFVNKKYPELAQRIAKGLTILRENGEYQTLFNTNFGETLVRLNMKNRRIIELKNPLLSAESEQQMQQDKGAFTDLINNASVSP